MLPPDGVSPEAGLSPAPPREGCIVVGEDIRVLAVGEMVIFLGDCDRPALCRLILRDEEGRLGDPWGVLAGTYLKVRGETFLEELGLVIIGEVVNMMLENHCLEAGMQRCGWLRVITPPRWGIDQA